MPGPETAAAPEQVAELERLVAERRFDQIHQRLGQFGPPDMADVLEALPNEAEAVVFRLLGRERALDTFEYLTLASQER
ncbi:MAG TPA: hypothetical protein PLT07_12390, partial [Trueperaceae bacterium]|nr:hypothetical protein [Trueperaceae bacterium]